MKTKAFVTVLEPMFSPEVMPEAQLQLYSTAKPNREPVKILIIGSQVAVNTIIHSLHHHHFAEPFEWTPFLPTDRPIQIRAGESLRSLVKYLPR
ncbi:MAG: hypothetical protein AAFV72_08330 [Cyanobacteria bacterium J06635_1]